MSIKLLPHINAIKESIKLDFYTREQVIYYFIKDFIKDNLKCLTALNKKTLVEDIKSLKLKKSYREDLFKTIIIFAIKDIVYIIANYFESKNIYDFKYTERENDNYTDLFNKLEKEFLDNFLIKYDQLSNSELEINDFYYRTASALYEKYKNHEYFNYLNLVSL